MSSDETVTPRVCEACNVHAAYDASPCAWCTDGYQDPIQQARWKEFRRNMAKISATYDIFEKLIRGIIERLEQVPLEEAERLAQEGQSELAIWLGSEPATDERTSATQELLAFQRRALDYLLKHPPTHFP